MNKKVQFLVEKYGITALSNDNLSLFVSEIYNDGYHDGKAFKERYMTIRDHFAGLAMQGLSTIDGYIGLDYIASDAYALADAMLKAREVGDDN